MAGTVTVSTTTLATTTVSATTVPAAADVTSLPRAAAAEPDRSVRWVPGELGLLDEPVELLGELRDVASDQPATARATAPSLLALRAIDAWEDQLDGLGVPASLVTQAFESCRREIWFWVDGDRRWEQLAAHLAQRVLRRAAHRSA